MPAPSTIKKLLTATCSNCRMTSPGRRTRAAGTDTSVRAEKSRKWPNCSSFDIPSDIIDRLLDHTQRRGRLPSTTRRLFQEFARTVWRFAEIDSGDACSRIGTSQTFGQRRLLSDRSRFTCDQQFPFRHIRIISRDARQEPHEVRPTPGKKESMSRAEGNQATSVAWEEFLLAAYASLGGFRQVHLA